MTGTTPAPREGLAALFEPNGIVVAGASSHPGKFGFVVLHNILAHGYAGRVLATNREGGEILGVRVATSVDELPQADSVYVGYDNGCWLQVRRVDVLTPAQRRRFCHSRSRPAAKKTASRAAER